MSEASAYTESLNRLIEQFGRLPGIGAKTAERLAMHVLKVESEEAMNLARAIRDVKKNIRRCEKCFNLSEKQLCSICQDQSRDQSIICIVEQPRDVITLEKTGMCKWVYHVLGGHIAPLEGVEPADLTIDALVERVRKDDIKELVMATNPNVTGDGTALYISSLFKAEQIKITRLARGLPTGTELEYAGGNILAEAILGRQKLE